MTTALVSFALISTQHEKFHKDYFDNFVPFFATMLKNHNLHSFSQDDIPKLTDYFFDDFGLKIPYHPIITILNRCKIRHLLQKKNEKYVIDLKVMFALEFSGKVNLFEKRKSELIKEYILFSKTRYKLIIDVDTANKILLLVLKDNDVGLVFSNPGESMIPDIIKPKESEQYKYSFYQFAIDAYKNNDKIYSCLIDLAFGNIISKTILIENYQYTNDTLKNCNIFIDTPLILNLIGCDGLEFQKVYETFFSVLVKAKCNLLIFQHTLDEINELLESARDWISSPTYDYSMASRMLKSFKEKNYNKSDVERFLYSVNIILKQYKIQVFSKSEIVKKSTYQIDEKLLKKMIEENMTNCEAQAYKYRTRTQRDVDSISAIYQLRKNNNPKYLRDAKYCFITTNTKLVFVNFEYKKILNMNQNDLPVCLTDTFIGTLLWLKQPKKRKEEINNRFLAECYSAISVDENIEKLLIYEAKRLQKNGTISESDFLLLTTSHLTFDLLNEKTLNDPENFKPETSFDILENIKDDIREKELTEHAKTKEKLAKVEKKLIIQNKIRLEEISQKAKNYAIISNILYGIVLFLLIILPIPFCFSDSFYFALISFFGALVAAYFSYFKGFTFKENYNIKYKKKYEYLTSKYNLIIS